MERQNRIESLLKQNIDISYLELLNESHMHSVPENSETHFKLTIVSEDFEGKRKVARHQMIYSLLGGLMQEGLHAIAIHSYTPDEWHEVNNTTPDSPNCMGGSKSDK